VARGARDPPFQPSADCEAVKLRLLCIGRLSERWLQQGAEEYTRRINRYLPLEIVELREGAGGGTHGDIRFGRDEEGERLLRKIPSQAFVVILDEGGKPLHSEAWAELFADKMLHGIPEIVLVIGGAYGLSPAVKERGNLILSLSAMTLPHQLARVVLLEQTYRAMTILRHEPYHNR